MSCRFLLLLLTPTRNTGVKPTNIAFRVHRFPCDSDGDVEFGHLTCQHGKGVDYEEGIFYFFSVQTTKYKGTRTHKTECIINWISWIELLFGAPSHLLAFRCRCWLRCVTHFGPEVRVMLHSVGVYIIRGRKRER